MPAGLDVRNGWKADIAKARPLTQSGSVVWLFRRLLIPFALGTIVCAAIFIVWALAATESQANVTLRDIFFATYFIMPFEALGLLLLLPIALVIGDRLPWPLSVLLLVLIGALLGVALVLPISEAPTLLDFALPATCGAVSALIWFLVNRDVGRR